MDIDDRIASSGCHDQYRKLDDCLIESDRDWRRCQVQVTDLRKCMESRPGSVGSKHLRIGGASRESESPSDTVFRPS